MTLTSLPTSSENGMDEEPEDNAGLDSEDKK